MPRPGRQERAERILDTAARLFVRYGYDKTTVDEIAREAGVAKGTLYLYWPSKEVLAEALLYREVRRVAEDFLRRLEADPEGGTIGSIYRHSLLVTFANPFVRAVLTSDNQVLGDYLRRLGPDYYQMRFQAARALVERMQAAGLVRSDLRPETIAYLLTMWSLGLASAGTLIPAAIAPPPDEVAAALADVVQRSLAPEGGGDKEAGKRLVREYVAEVTQQYEELRGLRRDVDDGQPSDSG